MQGTAPEGGYSMEERLTLWKVIGQQLKCHKLLRVFLVLLIGLWIAAGTKYVTERIYSREENLREAFAGTDPGQMTSTLEFAAEYKNGFITERDKEDFIRYIAGRLGITIDSDYISLQEGKRTELVFEKKAKQAVTTIKVISLSNEDGLWKHYCAIRLSILNDTSDSAVYYRSRLEEITDELEIAEAEVSLTIEGSYHGDLSLVSRNQIADRMLRKLDGTVISENRGQEMYTIYAYTRGRKEYIESDGRRINIQLAMYYDELRDETVVYLASPIINRVW